MMAVVLMLGLEVMVWADEDDEKAEMRDFVAAVYRGQGQYNMAGSIANGEGGVMGLSPKHSIENICCNAGLVLS